MDDGELPWHDPKFRAQAVREGFGLRAAVAEWTRASPGNDGIVVSAFRTLDIWQVPNSSLPDGKYDQVWLRSDLRVDGQIAFTVAPAGTERPPTVNVPGADGALPAMRNRLLEIQGQLLDKPNTRVLPPRDHRQRFAALRAEYHPLRLGSEWGGPEDDARLRLLAEMLAKDSRGPRAVLADHGLADGDDIGHLAKLARQWERAARRAK